MVARKLEALVEYEYKAEQDDELTLKVGDIIKDVQTSDGGWWEGELNGKKGMFPENFVKLITRRDEGKKDQKRAATQRKSVRVLAQQFKSDGIPMGPPPIKKEKKKMCKVLFDYKKENDDELDLVLGDLIEFHKEVEDGWWEGTANGKHGVFPSNFVEMVEESGGSTDDSASASAAAASATEDKNKTADDPKSSSGDFQAIKGKKVVGVGLGNIFGGGPIVLRPTGDKGIKSQDAAKPAKPTEPESAPEVHKREKQNTSERAIVRFSYAAEQPDELSLLEGQVVKIIEKQLDDEGWWKGEVNGKIGVFPDNFVELLPPDESSKPKKPLPPTTASKQNFHSKLPTGDSVDDNKKTDSAAPVVVKKAQPPPPIGKKPDKGTRPEPPKPAMVKSTSKDNNTDNRPTPEDGAQFDSIDASSPKLTHLTANRAKGPKKRPPSTVLNLNDMDKDVDSVEETKPNSHHPPERPEKPHHVPPAKDNKHPPSEPEPPSLSHHQHHHHSQPPHTVHTTSAVHRDSHHSGGSAPSRPPEPSSASSQSSSATNAQTNKLIEQLQREIAELKANSVSKSAFNELKAEHERLRSDFETMRAANSKKFRELINEVDEEKKLRLTTQVEIERVKKMVVETNV